MPPLQITVPPAWKVGSLEGAIGEEGTIEPAGPSEAELEGALVQKVVDRRVNAANAWLDSVARAPAAAVAQEPQPPSDADLAEEARTAAAERVGRTREPKPIGEGMSAGDMGRDVARGLTEVPRQVVGGMRDAAQAAINGLGAVGDWLNANYADLGTLKLLDPEGGTSIGGTPVLRPRLEKSAAKAEMPQLPEVKPAVSGTGAAVREVSQFLTGFIGAGKVLGAAAPGGFAGAMAKGALADLAAFDGHEKRLADLIQQVPALQNPVTEFLASSADDSELAGRFKRAVEGLGLGAGVEGLTLALRAIKAARAARAQGDGAAAATAPAAREAQPLKLLGDDSEAAPLVGKLPAPDTIVPDDVVAKSLTPKGLQQPGAKFKAGEGFTPLFGEGKNTVYVNFAKINSGGDVKRVIADTVEAFKGDIDKARRGVRTHKETLEAAGGEDAWKIVQERRQGAALNAEESTALRLLWEASAAKLLDVAEAATRNPSPENLYQFRKMMAIHHTVQMEAIAARTESARALNSWAIPVGGGGAERLRAIENLLATYGGDVASAVMAQRVAALKDAPHGLAALDQMALKAPFARTVDAVKELWINALLSSPHTHVVNMMGNTMGVLQDMVERAAASRLSQALGSGEIAIGEAAEKAFATGAALREAWSMFLAALRTGESRFGVETTKVADAGFVKAISAEHQGVNPESWLGKGVDAMGTMVNLPVRFLNAEDDFFKSIAYRMEVNALAFRQASREVQDGQLARADMRKRIEELAANPPEHVKLSAIDAATYQTFTKKPGAVVEAINNLDRKLMASEWAGAQLGSLAMRMMVPFRNTPANLLNYAFERTPLAPLMSRWREDVAAGGARADVAVTRMALGTMTLMAMVDLALDGHITGGGPRGDENRGVRQTLQRSGWQPYSVKVGDRYVSYRRTDPIGISLTMAADLAEVISNANIDEDKKQSILQVASAAALSFGNSMLDKTYLQSVAELIDAMKNPQSKGPTFVQKRLAGFEPAAIGLVRRNVDPYMRYTATLTDELRNRTPGLSESLPLARDMWGRPRTYQSGLGQVYDAISPIYSRKFNPEPIDKAALDQGWHLEMPPWSLAFGKGVTVSTRNAPEAYSRYLELRAQAKPSDIGEISPLVRQIERRVAARGDGDWKAVLKEMKVPQRDLTPAGLIYLKYGDRPMIDVLNAMVKLEEGDPVKAALAVEFGSRGEGRGGGQEDLVKKVISDYGRAARMRLLDEFEFVSGVVTRKREKRDASR